MARIGRAATPRFWVVSHFLVIRKGFSQQFLTDLGEKMTSTQTTKCPSSKGNRLRTMEDEDYQLRSPVPTWGTRSGILGMVRIGRAATPRFAVVSHFPEDRVPLADLWPQEESLWGGSFANPI